MKHLLQFIDYKGLTIHAFEKKLGIRSTIDKAIKQNTNLRSDIFTKIIETFPEINASWLITGKGEMLLQQVATAPKTVAEPSEKYGKSDIELINERIAILTELNKEKDEIISLLKEKVSMKEEALQQCLQEKNLKKTT